jgi:ribA/ribD-fused uncharacterized protein
MIKGNSILQFREEYNWLSNFFPCDITVDGKKFPSVEHAYMSFKNSSEDWQSKCMDKSIKAGQIKRLSREIELVEGWDGMKVSVMRKCLEAKFRIPAFRNKLIETGDSYIAEGNWWGDYFWGVDSETQVGENNLGKLLMEIRERVRIEDGY